MVDENWQSDVKGLYVAGEAAGTFGVYRPGGSALNSTQVGSLRAAEHIAKKKAQKTSAPAYALPVLTYGKENLASIRQEMQCEMSRVADFDRSTVGMKELLRRVSDLCKRFFEQAVIADDAGISELFKLYDMALTQRATLSAMISSAEALGTHGSAFIDRKPNRESKEGRRTRTLTRGALSRQEAVSPMPNPELWFETLLARQRKEDGI